MARPKLSAEIARIRFLRAAIALALDREPRNPLQILLDEAYPAWRNRRYPPVDNPMRFPQIYRSSKSSKEYASNARQVLRQWALGNNLREFGNSTPTPPAWLIDFAEEQCNKWHLADFPSSDYSSSAQAYAKTLGLGESTDPLNLGTGEPPYLTIAMEDPSMRVAENVEDYARRIRRAVSDHLKLLRKPRRVPAQPRQSKTAPYELDHYKWLILRHCCGLKLSEIRMRYDRASDGAIWQGIRHKQRLLGLAPLTRQSPR